MALTKLGGQSPLFASYYFITFTRDTKWPNSPRSMAFPVIKEKDYEQKIYASNCGTRMVTIG